MKYILFFSISIANCIYTAEWKKRPVRLLQSLSHKKNKSESKKRFLKRNKNKRTLYPQCCMYLQSSSGEDNNNISQIYETNDQ